MYNPLKRSLIVSGNKVARGVLSLRGKLYLGFGGLLAILLLVGGLGLGVINHYSETIETIFRENYASVSATLSMTRELNEIERTLLLYKNRPSEQARDQILGMVGSFESHLDFQLTNSSLPEERELTETLSAEWHDFRALLEAYFAAPSSVEVRLEYYYETLRPRAGYLLTLIHKIRDVNLQNMALMDGQAAERADTINYAMLLLLTSGAVLGLVYMFLVGRIIMQPIQELSESAREIERGNLNLMVSPGGRDELGQLAHAFNAMAARLREFRRQDDMRLGRIRRTTQLAIDSLRDPIALLDPNGTIEVSNQAAKDILGIIPGYEAGSLGLDWFPDIIERCRTGEGPFLPATLDSARQHFVDGKERFFLPAVTPVYDEQEQLLGYTFVASDVTRLHQIDEIKTGMISTVSHELKTPLTSMRMALYILLERRFGQLTEKQLDLVKAARDDCERLFQTIENLLDLSRVQQGKDSVEREEVDIVALVGEAAGSCEMSFKEAGVELSVEAEEGLPRASVDPKRFAIVLSNLLTNALKYSGRGGATHVRIGRANGDLEISVSDSGPGVPAEYTERIFGKFFRLPDQAEDGAGLGLAISREIVQAHGGSIRCESEQGKGAVFRIRLPLGNGE